MAPSPTNSSAAGSFPAPGSRRPSMLERVKRAASQPTLSGASLYIISAQMLASRRYGHARWLCRACSACMHTRSRRDFNSHSAECWSCMPAGLPQALGVPQIVKAAEALVARVDTSGALSSAASSGSANREPPPLQAPAGQPSPG